MKQTEVTEHRYSRRFPLRLDVWLNRYGRKLGPFRTRNVCRDGMFIENHDAELYPNDMLTVEFCAESEGVAQPIDVIVTYRSSDGIGVLISKYDLDLCQKLQTLNTEAHMTNNGQNVASGESMSDGNQEDEWVLSRTRYKINSLQDAEVQVCKKCISGDVTVTIKAADMLDLRAVDLMRSACVLARRYKAKKIVVDLHRTNHIKDSGLAMLLLLKKYKGEDIKNINLINAGHLMHGLDQLPMSFEIN